MSVKNDGADAFEIYLSCIPVAGAAGAITGVIDLDYNHSRKKGQQKIQAFLISHTVYILLFIILGVML